MEDKVKLIKDFNKAFENNNLTFILDHMSESIVWNFVGENLMQGKKEVHEFLKPMSRIKTLEMELLQIIDGEKSGAANGTMKIREPSGAVKSFGFSDFYEFESAVPPKISKLTSYVVSIDQKQKPVS